MGKVNVVSQKHSPRPYSYKWIVIMIMIMIIFRIYLIPFFVYFVDGNAMDMKKLRSFATALDKWQNGQNYLQLTIECWRPKV